MSSTNDRGRDYSTLTPKNGSENKGAKGRDYASVSAFSGKSGVKRALTEAEQTAAGLKNRKIKTDSDEVAEKSATLAFKVKTGGEEAKKRPDDTSSGEIDPGQPIAAPEIAPETPKEKKKAKLEASDRKVLRDDRWLFRNGHALSFAGLFLFTAVLYFRPYELIPALAALSSLALVIAIGTLAVFFPTQLSVEGNLTARPIEVTAVLLLTLLALITIPIAKSPGLAWETFNDTFIKVVLMFIVMVNVMRTEMRLKGMIWLSLAVGVFLGINAMELYRTGQFNFEDYRVGVEMGGMFGNPNELALHFVMFIPVAVALGLAARSSIGRLIYFGVALLMLAGTVVTFSRGGFLALIAASVFMAWKLAKENRWQVLGVMAVIGVLFILLAPGNYGMRILSIFIPGLDAVGSSDQRKDLLMRSILVSLRNPWGIGMGNFNLVGFHNLGTHNSYTQVSSELGVLGLAAYMAFLVAPFRRLSSLERELRNSQDYSWMYYLAIGLQGCLVAYMVGSFFGHFAFHWFAYYPVAFAIALRRIYVTGEELQNRKKGEFGLGSSAQWQPI
jgi:O-antigen ligase